MTDTLDTSTFIATEQGSMSAPEVAPEPAPEAEAVETEEAEAPEAEVTEPEVEEEAPKPKKTAQKTAQERIDEITRARREAEREAKYWRDVAEGRAKPQQDQPEADKAPDPNDYELGDMDPRYLNAVVDFRVNEGLRKGLDSFKSDMAQDLQRQAGARAWEATQDAARAKFADYDTKVIDGADNWPCTPEMAEAIRTSDAGGELAYHLASNPDEARRISALSPFAQVRELGRLEARLETPPEKPVAKTTQAPKPATSQVRGAGGQFSVAPDTDDFAAFEKSYGGSMGLN